MYLESEPVWWLCVFPCCFPCVWMCDLCQEVRDASAFRSSRHLCAGNNTDYDSRFCQTWGIKADSSCWCEIDLNTYTVDFNIFISAANLESVSSTRSYIRNIFRIWNEVTIEELYLCKYNQIFWNDLVVYHRCHHPIIITRPFHPVTNIGPSTLPFCQICASEA